MNEYIIAIYRYQSKKQEKKPLTFFFHSIDVQWIQKLRKKILHPFFFHIDKEEEESTTTITTISHRVCLSLSISKYIMRFPQKMKWWSLKQQNEIWNLAIYSLHTPHIHTQCAVPKKNETKRSKIVVYTSMLLLLLLFAFFLIDNWHHFCFLGFFFLSNFLLSFFPIINRRGYETKNDFIVNNNIQWVVEKKEKCSFGVCGYFFWRGYESSKLIDVDKCLYMHVLCCVSNGRRKEMSGVRNAFNCSFVACRSNLRKVNFWWFFFGFSFRLIVFCFLFFTSVGILFYAISHNYYHHHQQQQMNINIKYFV